MIILEQNFVNAPDAIRRCVLLFSNFSMRYLPTCDVVVCSQYTYLSLGCSKAQEQRMLNFARAQVGKPFSNMGMARSLFFPRTTTMSSFYCAELVAAILKQGGMMSSDSNPGAATPYSLYKLYSKQGAATANPYTLRQVGGSLNFSSIVHRPVGVEQQSLLNPQQAQLQTLLATQLRAPTGGSMRRRDDSPPRASFKLLSVGRGPSAPPPGITLSLSSLRS